MREADTQPRAAVLTSPLVAILPAIWSLMPHSQEQQDAAVKFTFPMFSNPMTADEFLAKFEAGK